MRFAIWLSFIGASVVFGLVPGPSVCFTMAHALRHGARRTLATVAGQLAANGCQILVVLFGLSGAIGGSPLFFQGLKLGGAAYLVYLGYRQWTTPKPRLNLTGEADPPRARRAFIDGFVVCGTNPKAVIYYAALLPQFVLPQYDKSAQLITLALTSIVIAALVLIFYALLAAKARSWFNREERWKAQNRVIAALMVSAGLALALVSK